MPRSQYTSKICARTFAVLEKKIVIHLPHRTTEAFPPGKHHRIPPKPHVDTVNRLGDYGLAADRASFISGSPKWEAVKPRLNYERGFLFCVF